MGWRFFKILKNYQICLKDRGKKWNIQRDFSQTKSLDGWRSRKDKMVRKCLLLCRLLNPITYTLKSNFADPIHHYFRHSRQNDRQCWLIWRVDRLQYEAKYNLTRFCKKVAKIFSLSFFKNVNFLASLHFDIYHKQA